MALHLPTFLTRTGSAIVFGIIMLAGLLWNEWAFLVLFSIVTILCIKEFFRLVAQIDKELYIPSWLPIVVQLLSLSVLAATFFAAQDYTNYLPAFCLVPITLILVLTLSKKNAWPVALHSLAVFAYITLSITLLLLMRMQSILLPIALILMIWVNDTMAYIVGSFIGKKPFSSISPKKTLEGTIGGALLTIIAAAIWGYNTSYYQLVDWMMLALCAAVAGTVGDLLESKLKRMAGVKDSGTIMPGHGGALDRFDSLLVATPFAFCYAYFFMPPLPLVIF
jgi:phosphatidate cytidylyltransferase